MIDTMHPLHPKCTRFQVLFFDAYRLWHSGQKGLKGQKRLLAVEQTPKLSTPEQNMPLLFVNGRCHRVCFYFLLGR